MPDFDPETSFETDPQLSEIRAEFSLGLPGRLQKMTAALSSLAQGYDAEAAERFFQTAHALKGTAPSFGARELVEDAIRLTELGRGWLAAGEVSEADLDEARSALEGLGSAADRFRRRIGYGGPDNAGEE